MPSCTAVLHRISSVLVLPALVAGLSPALRAQQAPAAKAPLSPPASAEANLASGTIKVTYSAPSLRGRHIGGPEIVPYGKVWRTGANPATTIVLPMDATVGTLKVPAGTYTLFTLPTADQWTLIVSKKTGEWGIPYPEGSDLGKTPMMSKEVSSPQEKMSITFEHTTANSTELHIRWDKADEYVTIKTGS